MWIASLKAAKSACSAGLLIPAPLAGGCWTYQLTECILHSFNLQLFHFDLVGSPRRSGTVSRKVMRLGWSVMSGRTLSHARFAPFQDLVQLFSDVRTLVPDVLVFVREV